MKTEEVTNEFVERVEFELGMGCHAWDMVDSKEIIAAVLNIARDSHFVSSQALDPDWAAMSQELAQSLETIEQQRYQIRLLSEAAGPDFAAKAKELAKRLQTVESYMATEPSGRGDRHAIRTFDLLESTKLTKGSHGS